MRTLMIFSGMVMLASGTFCIANANVPFLSVQFIVGIAILFLGFCELLVTRVMTMRPDEDIRALDAEGYTEIVLGVVFLSAQITELITVMAIFALWSVVEGCRQIAYSSFKIRENSRDENFSLLLGILMAGIGIYMFFNKTLLNISPLVLIGIVLFLIGINRFGVGMAIEYKKPKILTGSHEKLEEAERERKAAMQKAKEGVRESKIAENKISRIKKQIAKEHSFSSGIDERMRK